MKLFFGNIIFCMIARRGLLYLNFSNMHLFLSLSLLTCLSFWLTRAHPLGIRLPGNSCFRNTDTGSRVFQIFIFSRGLSNLRRWRQGGGACAGWYAWLSYSNGSPRLRFVCAIFARFLRRVRTFQCMNVYKNATHEKLEVARKKRIKKNRRGS